MQFIIKMYWINNKNINITSKFFRFNMFYVFYTICMKYAEVYKFSKKF